MEARIKTLQNRMNLSQLLILFLLLGFFTIVLILPVLSLFSKAFLDSSGNFAGLLNYKTYFGTPALTTSIINTLDISVTTTVFSVILGFLYAYGLTRTNMRWKRVFHYAALIPIFIPTVVHALGLVYIFGNQGLLTSLGLETQLYGRFGIILSEIIYTFPQSFLMFYVVLEFADGRLYEAADTMGCSPAEKFFRITLPEVKYTVVNVFFVCFTLAFTDFGAPKVIGGSYNVLATDIYKQIAGQFNMNMGAVVGTLLLIPAIMSFITQRIIVDKNASTLSSKTTQLRIKKDKTRDRFYFFFCIFIAGSLAALILSICMGAFTTYFPYDMTFTWKNFVFNISTGGLDSYLNSLRMSVATAVFGTSFVFVYAYVMEKTRGYNGLRRYGKLLSVLPLALPGMVVGLSYIFFFNQPSNPLNFVYGTIVILVLANIIHYFSVPYVTATGALKKLDKEFENVSESMNIPRWKTLLYVTAPLSLPAILEIFMYYFVNSMVTVSAVVFLYSAEFKIASIAITHMEEAGDFSQAAAMSLLILIINVAIRAAYEAAVRVLRKRSNQKGRVQI